MLIRDHIRKAAREIAKSMEARLANIKHRLVEAKEKVSEIEAERDAVATAQKRLSNFRIERGGTYMCPRCWLEKEVCRRSGVSRALRAKNFSAAQCASTNS